MASTTAGRGPRVPALAMTWATGVALLARGGIGLPVSLAFGLDTRFGQLDALIYSPLCLALGAATILVARRSPQRHPTRGTAIVSRDTPTRPLSHGWPDNVVEQTARRSEPRKRQLRSNVPREPCPIGIGPKRAFLFHCYREAWLARHRYGPLEWLLRWATTLQRPPLRGRTGHSRTATAPPSSTELPREKDLR